VKFVPLFGGGSGFCLLFLWLFCVCAFGLCLLFCVMSGFRREICPPFWGLGFGGSGVWFAVFVALLCVCVCFCLFVLFCVMSGFRREICPPCLLRAARCLLLAACCLLPVACCLLPAACCPLPAVASEIFVFDGVFGTSLNTLLQPGPCRSLVREVVRVSAVKFVPSLVVGLVFVCCFCGCFVFVLVVFDAFLCDERFPP
jgi:hypothetical protein